MTRIEILEQITRALAEVVDDPDVSLTEETTAEDVPEWDSTNHVRLIVELESNLNIQFAASEITSVPNVGALIDLIQSKTS
jgi:acyl carrier protein